YLKHRRDLPWRRTHDPYAIWVSEIMLQQTRVETVIPYYHRFLERFPDVRSLAKASEADVLAQWSGLGYYGRARNLRDAASLLVREHAGRLPEDPAALRRLPGIGEYTAAAISSVAFGRAAAAVDGNVVRVLARIHGFRGRRDSAALRRRVNAVAEGLAEGPRPGDWTQALMELGATVCLPREPVCERCPARAPCVARRSGHADRYPEAAPVAAPKQEHRVILLARRNGRFLLIPDPAERGTVWTLPMAAAGADGARAARSLARRHGQSGDLRGPVVRFRHRTFSADIAFDVWENESAGNGLAATSGRWAAPRAIRDLPVRAPTLKAINGLRRKR
ncbi:MAG TPA: A/G-specific adenine glycosylase, partial [Candidatus Eisenbacteria bacterium]|nr:A/G-specific adenine glycosylase [Candidatus Eisenbacteria bacterium]